MHYHSPIVCGACVRIIEAEGPPSANFVSNKHPGVLTSYTSPGVGMQKKSSFDGLSSSTLWSSRHLLKPLTRPAQSDMPQLRLCQCWMSMFTRRRFPVARVRNMWLSLRGDVEILIFALLQSSSLEALLWRLEVAGRFLCVCR